MNIIICDDNENLLEIEERVCRQYIKSEDSLSCYLQSARLKDYLLAEKPDVDLFVLDIEMPEVNGIQLKNLISELYEDTNIVFITGHTSYMKEAFGKKVIGFLSRFEYEEKIGHIIEKIRNDKKNEKIIEIEEGKNVIRLQQKRILSVVANRIYTKVQYVDYYNADNNEIRILENTYRMSLQKWEDILDAKEFYRINRSTIISWHYVKYISDRIEMVNGQSYRIPTGKKRLMRERHAQYILSQCDSIFG